MLVDQLAAGKKLVITVQLADDVVTIPPPTGGGGDDGGVVVPPPPATGFDLNTNAVLLEAFNKRLDPLGLPDHVVLAPLGFEFSWQPYVSGFERQNSCYRWTGALIPLEDGVHKFRVECKSGGMIKLDGEVIWSVDREQDATSSPAGFLVEFERELVKGKPIPIQLLCIYQGFLHGMTIDWMAPSSGDYVPISMAFCVPPADWSTRLKTYQPAPVEPPPGVILVPQPNWDTYKSPALPKLFPVDNWWNIDIDQEPVDPNSSAIIASLEASWLHPVFGKGINGIPFEVVPEGTPKVPVKFEYSGESDPGPYPIPENPVLESNGDINGGNADVHWIGYSPSEGKIYEIYQLQKTTAGWVGLSGAIFNANSNLLRPLGWTSGDAAGLAILPGLLTFDEVMSGTISHALRCTVGRTQKAFILPATHYTNHYPADLYPDFPPMGCRLRIKASFDESPFSAPIQTIIRGIKKKGMFVSDNGSRSFVGICGTPDSRWDDMMLAALKQIKAASALEVVLMGDKHFSVPIRQALRAQQSQSIRMSTAGYDEQLSYKERKVLRMGY